MHGGWCWREVRQRLTDRGHRVFTPTLTGQGDRRASCTPEVGVSTHVTDITDLLWFEDLTGVHLVLHSYAGILAGPIAGGSADRLGSISLLGGFITRSGECLLDVEPEEVADRYRRQAESAGGGWLVPADPAFLTQWGVTDGDSGRLGGPPADRLPIPVPDGAHHLRRRVTGPGAQGLRAPHQPTAGQPRGVLPASGLRGMGLP